MLPDHPRRADVHAVLVESDERSAGPARQTAADRDLDQVEVRTADASLVASFADALPADILLLCGIFGNISNQDIERTIQTAPGLCRAGATVIWTRGRFAPDLTPQVRVWFTRNGFEEVAFDILGSDAMMSVGAARLTAAPPAAAPPDAPLFTFRR